MFFKINRSKKAQVLLEYVILLAITIAAIVAVNFALTTLKGSPSEPHGFEYHFKQMAQPAGGVVLP